MDASKAGGHVATVTAAVPPQVASGAAQLPSAMPAAADSPAAALLSLGGRCLGDAEWWEDAACCCEERCVADPAVRQSDADSPEI